MNFIVEMSTLLLFHVLISKQFFLFRECQVVLTQKVMVVFKNFLIVSPMEINAHE